MFNGGSGGGLSGWCWSVGGSTPRSGRRSVRFAAKFPGTSLIATNLAEADDAALHTPDTWPGIPRLVMCDAGSQRSDVGQVRMGVRVSAEGVATTRMLETGLRTR